MPEPLYLVRSKTGCPSCVKAKALLASKGIAFVEELYDDFDERQTMYDKLGLVDGQRTVPQIERHDFAPSGLKITHIRGLEALHNHLLEMELFA